MKNTEQNLPIMNLIEWEDVRKDNGYPLTDNNDGHIFGIEFVDKESEEVLEIQWFKTEEERGAFL